MELNFELASQYVKERTEKKPLYLDRYFYNDTEIKYFDVKWFNFKNNIDLARHLWIAKKDLEDLRVRWVIPTYEWVCYYDWWREWYYNLLNKNDILEIWDTPTIHPLIEQLIKNLCNYQDDNIEHLLSLIYYKYTHLNDVYIPAVIFHWQGGSWKGLFMKLLSKIFWEKNTQIWLTQESIDSHFSAYSGQKLIVEFKEIMVENTIRWKKNMNKLKALIMEDKIMIEKKWQDAISVDNIAWFIMSSNEKRPVHLDWEDSGNRRFTIIKTWWKINNWKEIDEVIQDINNIKNFLAYLKVRFPLIEKQKKIYALENKDKKRLQEQCETVGNLFFKWFENKFPDINEITNHERDALVFIYRNEIGDIEEFEDWYKTRFFNAWLSMRYDIINSLIRWKQQRWYKINKQWRQFTDIENQKILKYLNK